jgi:hypothetical protein
MSLTALASVVRSAWQRPKRPLVPLPSNSLRLYERIPPAWARWALVLVAVDVMVSCVYFCLLNGIDTTFHVHSHRTSAVDVVWNAWTMPDPALQVEGNDARPAVGELRPSALSMLQIIPPGHVLRPAWQRALSGCSSFRALSWRPAFSQREAVSSAAYRTSAPRKRHRACLRASTSRRRVTRGNWAMRILSRIVDLRHQMRIG